MPMREPSARKLALLIPHIGGDRIEDQIAMLVFAHHGKAHTAPIRKGEAAASRAARVLFYKASLGQHQRRATVHQHAADTLRARRGQFKRAKRTGYPQSGKAFGREGIIEVHAKIPDRDQPRLAAERNMRKIGDQAVFCPLRSGKGKPLSDKSKLALHDHGRQGNAVFARKILVIYERHEADIKERLFIGGKRIQNRGIVKDRRFHGRLLASVRHLDRPRGRQLPSAVFHSLCRRAAKRVDRGGRKIDPRIHRNGDRLLRKRKEGISHFGKPLLQGSLRQGGVQRRHGRLAVHRNALLRRRQGQARGLAEQKLRLGRNGNALRRKFAPFERTALRLCLLGAHARHTAEPLRKITVRKSAAGKEGRKRALLRLSRISPFVQKAAVNARHAVYVIGTLHAPLDL